MQGRNDPASQGLAADGSLALRTTDDTVMVTFSDETVTAIRRMLTNLLYQATMPKRIASVAALREEGVTYLSLAMAATLASDLNVRVCAVELNWWHPSMHLYLAGQPPTPTMQIKGQRKRKPKKAKGAEASSAMPSNPPQAIGLGAVLREVISLEQALVPTALPNLSLLPAGFMPVITRSATARSEQLKAVIAQLAEQFDYLIMDIPAVAISSDTTALTALAEGVAVVVRQGVTPTHTVKETLDEVKHVPVLGVILNQVYFYTPRWILNLLPQE